MTIIVKMINRSGGREIVRPTRIDKSELLIGRSTTCDIHLPDLLVALEHARLTYTGGGEVRIESLDAGKPLRVDGGLTRRRDLKVDGAADIRIGPYALTPELDPETRELAVRVERVEPVRPAIDPDTEARVFSIRHAIWPKRSTSWVLAALVLSAFLAWPIWAFGRTAAGDVGSPKVAEPSAHAMLVADADRAWDSGAMSSVHANIAADCTTCHAEPFVSVRDEVCLTCHEGLRNHAEPRRLDASHPEAGAWGARLSMVSEAFGRPVARCSSCHMEHNGPEGLVIEAQADCVACHADLTARLDDTALRNAADFGAAHPQFSPTIVADPGAGPAARVRVSLNDLQAGRAVRAAAAPPLADRTDCGDFALGRPNFRGLPTPELGATAGDRSGLIFPHDVHLDSGGCVARMATELTRAAQEGRPAGHAFRADALVCADCHKEDAGGALFEPVRMEQSCEMCHSLTFEAEGGVERKLRHGQPDDVIATLRDFFRAQALDRVVNPAFADEDRRRPGSAFRVRLADQREAAFAIADERAVAATEAVFEEGGACFGCHVVAESAAPEMFGGVRYTISPVEVADVFLPKAMFDHAAHTGVDLSLEGAGRSGGRPAAATVRNALAEPEDASCLHCHAATTSSTSADVLLPGIDSCRDCHRGEHDSGFTPSGCTLCHGYHGHDGLPAMSPSRPQVVDLMAIIRG